MKLDQLKLTVRSSTAIISYYLNLSYFNSLANCCKFRLKPTLRFRIACSSCHPFSSSSLMLNVVFLDYCTKHHTTFIPYSLQKKAMIIMPCFTAVTSHLAGCQRQTLHIFQRSPSTKATRTRDTFESLNKNITNIDGCIPVSIHNHTRQLLVQQKSTIWILTVLLTFVSSIIVL